ncbi:MAG: hypothetical protein V2A64_07055 [Candidatus Omnitrophota bacterium]
MQHRKVYNILPKPPPDLLCKSKRLGLRKSPITGDTCLPAGRKVIAEGDFLAKLFLRIRVSLIR